MVRLTLILAWGIFGCSNEMAFDPKKWGVRDDMTYPYRERMVADLLKRYSLKGLDYGQVVGLLGKPEGADSLQLTYTLRLEYGLNIDPVYVKNLELQLDLNAKVVEYGVKEYESE